MVSKIFIFLDWNDNFDIFFRALKIMTCLNVPTSAFFQPACFKLLISLTISFIFHSVDRTFDTMGADHLASA